MIDLLTDAHIDAYRRDGAVVVRNVFDDAWLEVLEDGIAENLAHPSKRHATLFDDAASHQNFFFDARALGEIGPYDRLMLDSPMAEMAARFMGSRQAILYYISVFVRSAGTRARTPWHQDQPSWSAVGDQALSIWLCLDSVSKETALEFVRGSHRWGTDFERPEFFHHAYAADDRTAKAAFPDIEGHRDRFDIVSWAMEPGDCVVFHGMTVHGGSGNLPAGLGRRNVSVQWLGDDARYQPLARRDDNHITEELAAFGVKAGDPVVCDMCPVAWPRA